MMIKGKIALLFTVISFVFSGMTHAADTAPAIIDYPTTLIIPFAAVNKPLTLEFNIVNNTSHPIMISNPQFVRIKSNAGKNVFINNIRASLSYAGDDCSSNGILSSATMSNTGAKIKSCHIVVMFNATGVQPNGGLIGPEEYQLQLNYVLQGQAPLTLVSRPVRITYASGELQKTLLRTLTVRNLCNYPVWVGLNGGQTSNIYATNATDASDCQTDADCFPGAACTNSRCFWKNPDAANSNYRLGANGGATTFTIPVYSNGNGYFNKSKSYVPDEITWSGSIAGRVNCTAKGCQIADCSGDMGSCKPGHAFTAPATTAEFTLTRTKILTTSMNKNSASTDIYAVNIINGVTVPISMTPDNASWGGQSSAYTCGSAGGTNVSAPLSACTWRSAPPSNDFRYVYFNTNTDVCETDQDCNSSRFVKYWGTGMVCGLAKIPNSSIVRKQCGLPSPFYWTPNAVCKASDNQYNKPPFSCSTQLPGEDLPFSSLYECISGFVQSCYLPRASTSCCGCSNWGKIFPAQPFKACTNTANKLWSDYVLPSISWAKQACPLAKVYPYDDASSQFSCNNLGADNMNAVNYTVTFCPR